MAVGNFARREDCDLQHDKIEARFDKVECKLDYIVGKIDGISQQKGTDITFFGMLAAVMLGLWNMIK